MSSLVPKRVLITGATSCSGGHLIAFLRNREKYSLIASSRSAELPGGLTQYRDVAWIQIDFGNKQVVEDAIHKIRPDTVLHLAGCSDATRHSEMINTNIGGTWNLLSACESLAKPVSVLLVGSAASFGPMRDGETSLGSSRPGVPASLYGQTRQTSLELGRLVDGNGGVRVFLCRAFNLIGPGLATRYVPTALLQRIRNAWARGEKQIAVRDLDSVRDFIDVRDAVAAYLAIIESGRRRCPYSVGRGKGVTIGELAEGIVRALGIDMNIVPDHGCEANPRSGISRSIADPSDLVADTGWVPQISLEASIQDMLASPLATSH